MGPDPIKLVQLRNIVAREVIKSQGNPSALARIQDIGAVMFLNVFVSFKSKLDKIIFFN